MTTEHCGDGETRSNLMTSPQSTQQRIVTALAMGTLVIVFAISMAPLWPMLHTQWTEVTAYSHGYLLAGMSAWLVWRNWRASPPERIGPDWIFLAPFLAIVGVISLLELLFLHVPRLFFLPPLLVAGVGLVSGRSTAKLVLWPVLLLYCALPVWAAINGLLQTMTTATVAWGLSVTGVPAFIEGNFVNLPAGSFEIAEGCSGLRYLIIGTTLSLFYSLAFLSSWPRRGLLVATAVVISIVCNWIRVYVIILLGHLSQMTHPWVDDHIAFGWGLFVVVLIPLAWFGRRLEGRTVGEFESKSKSGIRLQLEAGAVVSVSAVACLLLIAARLVPMAFAQGGGSVLATEPLAASLFAAPIDSGWQPEFAGAVVSRAVIVGTEPPVDVYIARYSWQDDSHRLIAYGNEFVPNGWQPVSTRHLEISEGEIGFEPIVYEGYLGGRRRLILAWYWVAGVPATGPLEAKLKELRGLFMGRRDAAAVAISTECGVDTCGEAEDTLSAILSTSLHYLRMEF